MILRQQFDLDGFLRIDHAALIDFLTSNASFFAQHDLLSRRDIDSLRISLNSIHLTNYSQNGKLLMQLVDQKSELIKLVESRFGVVRFSCNLLRHTMRSHVEEMNLILSQWGEDLIQLARLFFNRPFVVYFQSEAEHEALQAQLLLEIAATISNHQVHLQNVCNDLKVMLGHGMAGDYPEDSQFDLGLAQALGFEQLDEGQIIGWKEGLAKRSVALAIKDISRMTSLVMQQIYTHHQSDEKYIHVLSLSELISSQAERLEKLNFPQNHSWVSWELRRQSINSLINEINQLIRSLHESFRLAVSPDHKIQKPVFAATIKRRLVHHLMGTSIPALDAQKAIDDLFYYTQQQSILPHEIIDSELSKINVNLSPSVLQLFCEVTKKSNFDSLQARAKQTSLKKTEVLLGNFRKITAQLAGTLTALIVLGIHGGCGHKTQPKTSEAELRPALPFEEIITREQETPSDKQSEESKQPDLNKLMEKRHDESGN